MFKNLPLVFLIFSNCLILGDADFNQFDIIENLGTLKLLAGLENLASGSECLDDIKNYTQALKAGEIWALTMFDSSAKIPDGILMGNTKFMGHFDECLAVQQPQGNFTGQHCMLGIDLTLQNLTSNETNRDVQTFGLEVQTISLSYGICLPSTCTSKEIEYALLLINNNTKLADYIQFYLDEKNCQTNESPALADSDWAVVGILGAFVAISFISTIYDLHQRFIAANEKPHPLLSSFSIYRNGKQLFKISDSSDQLGALHGIRFLSMCWVVLCHAYVMSVLSGPVVNFLSIYKKIMDNHHIVIINGFVSVDSFFFLSGLLVSFVFFREIGKKGYYDVILGYIHRYIRLTPPFAVMILITATLFPYMGDGPLWNNFVGYSANTCRQNWWSGLLYVQNFVAPNSTCLGQSWYLSTDMQFYWLSPLILFPVLFWPFLAPFYLVLLLLGAVFTTFAIAYVNDLGPNIFLTNVPNQMELDYVPFYTRAAPWLIGLTLGYIICGIKAKKIKIELSKFWIAIGWLLSTGICLGVLYGFVDFTDNEYTTVEVSCFLAFHRLGWGIGLAWIVFACVQGHGGPVNAFLSWGVFQPLGKLSYGAFLVHMTFQFYRLGTMRTNFYAGDLEIVYYFLGDLVLALLAAIPLTLIFEMPFGNIDRYIFQNVKILPIHGPKRANRTNFKRDTRFDIEPGIVNLAFESEKK